MVDTDLSNPARPRVTESVIALAVALFFALVAAASLYGWHRSNRALAEANATVTELIEAATETARPNAQPEIIDAIVAKARSVLGKTATPNNPRDVKRIGHAYLILAEIAADRGQLDRMREDARIAFADLDPLAHSGDIDARHLRAQAERLIGTAHRELGENDDAKLHYDRGIADLEDLIKRTTDPKISARYMRSLADLYESLGDLLLKQFAQLQASLVAFNKTRELRERLVELGERGPALERDLAWTSHKIAEAQERAGNTDAALGLDLEARDRMDAMKDKIWHNLRWASDYAVINADIGRLKRMQNRYAEAAAIFARAEEMLLTVYERDPTNVDRRASLNRVRFLRAENMLRLALQNNDRDRLLSAREQAEQVIAATTAELAGEPKQRRQARLNKIREEAFLAAIDANLRQINGNYDSAATGFLEAAEIITNNYLKDAANPTWPDLLREYIEYVEAAGASYVRAHKGPEAQALFRRALEVLVKNRQQFSQQEFDEAKRRIEARFDRSATPAEIPPTNSGRAPAPSNRAPSETDHTQSIDRATPVQVAPPATSEPVSRPQQ